MKFLLSHKDPFVDGKKIAVKQLGIAKVIIVRKEKV
jgi:hypothetical protein